MAEGNKNDVVIKVVGDVTDINAKLDGLKGKMGAANNPEAIAALKNAYANTTAEIAKLNIKLQEEIALGSKNAANTQKRIAQLQQNKAEIEKVTTAQRQNTETTKQTATAVDDMGKKSMTARQEMRQLTQSLVTMEQAGMQNTAAYKQQVKRLGELRDAMGDVRGRAKFFADDARWVTAGTQAVQGLIGAYSLYAGVSALVGKKDEELQKTMMKLQAAMSIMMGMQQVATALNKDSAFIVGLQTLAERAKIFIFGQSTVATAGLTVATEAETVALEEQSVAATASLGPYGLVLAAIVAIAAAATILVIQMNKETDAEREQRIEREKLAAIQDKVIEKTSDRRAQIDLLVSSLNKENLTAAEQKRIIGELDEAMGTNIGTIKDMNTQKVAAIAISALYVEKIKKEAELEAGKEMYQEAYKNRLKAQQKTGEDYINWYESTAQSISNVAEKVAAVTSFGLSTIYETDKNILDKTGEARKQQAINDEKTAQDFASKQVDISQAALDKVNANYKEMLKKFGVTSKDFPVTETKTAYELLVESISELEEKLREQAVTQGVLNDSDVRQLKLLQDKKAAVDELVKSLGGITKLQPKDLKLIDETILPSTLEKTTTTEFKQVGTKSGKAFLNAIYQEVAVNGGDIWTGILKGLFPNESDANIGKIKSELAGIYSDLFKMVETGIEDNSEVVIAAIAKELKKIDESISKKQQQVDEEKKLAEEGKANNLRVRQDELNGLLAVQAQEQAAKEEAIKKAREQEKTMATIKAATAFIVAVSEAVIEGGPLGIITGLAAGITMLAYIASAYGRASSSVQYGMGTAEILGGKSHSEGGTSLGAYGTAEKGELLGILNKRATQKYGTAMLSLFDGLNNANESKKLVGLAGLMGLRDISTTSTQTIELKEMKDVKEIKDIMKRPGKSTIYEGNKRIEKTGNHTRIIHVN